MLVKRSIILSSTMTCTVVTLPLQLLVYFLAIRKRRKTQCITYSLSLDKIIHLMVSSFSCYVVWMVGVNAWTIVLV